MPSYLSVVTFPLLEFDKKNNKNKKKASFCWCGYSFHKEDIKTFYFCTFPWKRCKVFVCFWLTGAWPHWTGVFTCREKVSCRSVSVSPAEDSRISLERRIRLEPWVGDRRRRDRGVKTKERTSWEHGKRAGKDGKITVSMPLLTPAESKQWTLINHMQREKRGSKGGSRKREAKKSKLTDRRAQGGKIEQVAAAAWKKN